MALALKADHPRKGSIASLETVCRPLPVYPYKQTSSALVGMSQRCQQRTFEMKEAAN